MVCLSLWVIRMVVTKQQKKKIKKIQGKFYTLISKDARRGSGEVGSRNLPANGS